MKRALGFSGSIAIGICLLSGPVVAHHSFAAAYNMQDPITVEGTIVDVRLTNPHSFFFLDVEGDDGEVVRWSFEAGTPGGMIRNGFSTEIIKEGVVVTISGFHAKDPDAPNGMLTELKLQDGTVYGMFGPREGPGAR